MTGAYLHERCRSLLRDNAQGVSGDGRTYTEEEIKLALEAARSEAIDQLLQMCDIVGAAPDFQTYVQNYSVGAAFPALRPRLTLSRLMSTHSLATAEEDTPDNFYKIECATDNELRYVPSQPVTLARSMEGRMPVIYATGKKVYTSAPPAVLMYYWRVPDTPIDDNGNDLTDIDMGLPDSFYETIKYLACARIVVKHGAGNKGLASALGQIYLRNLKTLR